MVDTRFAPTADNAVLAGIARAPGWVLDVDGCIVRTTAAGGSGGVPITGAVELVHWLKATGKKIVVCTNASQRTPARYGASLRAMGFDIEDGEMMTAATAAAAYVRTHHADGPVVAIGDEGLLDALRAEGVVSASDDPRPPVAVVVGAADTYATRDINAACLAIADNAAAFYVTVDTPWFHGGVKKAVSASTAIARAIESVTGRSPVVCGKPAAAIAEVISDRLGLAGRDLVVVGDMASIEVKMARDMRAYGVLVLSGGTGPEDLPGLPPAHQPDACFENVGALLQAIQKL
jgi:HAD superfamily hydrolase (TIGR01450 family)